MIHVHFSRALPAALMLCSVVAIGCPQGTLNGAKPQDANADTPDSLPDTQLDSSLNPQDSMLDLDESEASFDAQGDETPGDARADLDAPDDAPDLSSCQWRAVDGLVVIEAESLPLLEAWQTEDSLEGYTGAGYILWKGSPAMGAPKDGAMSIQVALDEPGRYTLQWRTRIGKGDNPTEHNDTWVRFPDAQDAYGLKGEETNEIRRYPKPVCQDLQEMNRIEALPNVQTASCASGASSDGWMKVYCSGARDWRWSTFTSDNDASIITMDIASAGVYTLEFAPRSDFHIIDRIVLHHERIALRDAQQDAAPQTRCP